MLARLLARLVLAKTLCAAYSKLVLTTTRFPTSQPMRNYPASLPIAGPSSVQFCQVRSTIAFSVTGKDHQLVGKAHDSLRTNRTCQKELTRFGPVANYSDSFDPSSRLRGDVRWAILRHHDQNFFVGVIDKQ